MSLYWHTSNIVSLWVLQYFIYNPLQFHNFFFLVFEGFFFFTKWQQLSNKLLCLRLFESFWQFRKQRSAYKDRDEDSKGDLDTKQMEEVCSTS